MPKARTRDAAGRRRLGFLSRTTAVMCRQAGASGDFAPGGDNRRCVAAAGESRRPFSLGFRFSFFVPSRSKIETLFSLDSWSNPTHLDLLTRVGSGTIVKDFRTTRSRSTGFSILRDIPFTVIVVHDSGATSFGDGGCAQAVTGGAVRGRRRRAGAGGGFPSLSAPPSLDRVRVWMVGTVAAAGEPRDRAAVPTSSIYGTA